MTEKSPWRVRMEARKIKTFALVDRPFPAIVEDAGGYYCLAKRADAVIAKLERELAAAKQAVQHANDHADAAIAELAAEKALADRAMKIVDALTGNPCPCGECIEALSAIDDARASHRKARGL